MVVALGVAVETVVPGMLEDVVELATVVEVVDVVDVVEVVGGVMIDPGESTGTKKTPGPMEFGAGGEKLTTG